MIIRDTIYHYMINVLGKASETPVSDLLSFIITVNRERVDQVLKKASELVDEVVPKTYKNAVKRAISTIDRKWWDTVENPPEWLARAAYIYVLGETLGEQASFPVFYERTMKLEEIAKSLPIFLSHGSHSTVLINPSKKEIEKEMSKEGVELDYYKYRHFIRDLVLKHIKVDIESMSVDVFGRKIFYDEESFLSLLSLVNKHDEKRVIIERVIERDLLPSLAKSLKLSESRLRFTLGYGYTSSEKEVKITVPVEEIEQGFPELKGLLKDLQINLRISDNRFKVHGISFIIKTTIDGMEQTFNAKYSFEGSVNYKDVGNLALEKFQMTLRNLRKLHEEMVVMRRLSETVGINEKHNRYVESYSREVRVEYDTTGRVQNSTVKLTYSGVIDDGVLKHRNITSRVLFTFDTKQILNLVKTEDLKYFLTIEGIPVSQISIYSHRNHHHLALSLEHKDPDAIRGEILKAIEVTRNYLKKIQDSVSSRSSLTDEQAVAIYFYSKVVDKDRVPAVFSRTHSEAFMKLGRMLSRINPSKYSNIRSWLNNMRQHGYNDYTLLDVFKDVSEVLLESKYVKIGNDGGVYVNGKRLADILHESSRGVLSKSAAEGIEQDVISELVRSQPDLVISKLIRESGTIPNSVIRALEKSYLLFEPSLLFRFVEDKPVAAYLPEDVKAKIAEKITSSEAVAILTTPEYEKYFQAQRNLLLEKVLNSYPGIITKYAYHAMPELFSDLPINVNAIREEEILLDVGKWYCQVGRVLGNGDKNVFILYKKSVGIGVAFVANNLREALAKAEMQYDEGIRVIELLKTSKPALSKMGLEFEEYKIYQAGLTLPYLYSHNERRNYYITPIGGTRLLDMLKEQKEEEVVANA